MAQARHVGLLIVSGWSIQLIKSSGGGVRTYALMEEGRETLGETV
jgi:hypothetical protein